MYSTSASRRSGPTLVINPKSNMQIWPSAVRSRLPAGRGYPVTSLQSYLASDGPIGRSTHLGGGQRAAGLSPAAAARAGACVSYFVTCASGMSAVVNKPAGGEDHLG